MKALKILIVDDNEGLAAVIQHMLDYEGYDSRVARNPAEAYRIFPLFRPSLVISDLHMPEQNGIEVIRRMRKFKNADFKTIYMSGDLNQFRTELEEEQQKYRATMLAKPFHRIELMQLVAEYERASATRAA